MAPDVYKSGAFKTTDKTYITREKRLTCVSTKNDFYSLERVFYEFYNNLAANYMSVLDTSTGVATLEVTTLLVP